MAEARPGLRLWDRLVLLVAWGATCGIVFLLGLSVGRGGNPKGAGGDDRVVRLPVTTPAPPVAPAAAPADDVTFYERLVAADRTQPRAAAPVPAPPRDPGAVSPPSPPKAKPAVAPSPAAAAQAAAAAKAVGASAPVVPAQKPAVAAGGKPAPTANRGVPTAAKGPAPTLGNVVVAPGTAAPKPTAKPAAPKVALAAAPTPAGTAPAVTPPTAKTWAVTINPTPDRYEAEALMHQLKAKGYSASLLQTAKGGSKQYRVRIGQYASSADAANAAKKLQKDGLQGAVPTTTD